MCFALCCCSFVALKIVFLTKWGEKHNSCRGDKSDHVTTTDGTPQPMRFAVNTGVVVMGEGGRKGGPDVVEGGGGEGEGGGWEYEPWVCTGRG